MNNSPYSNFLTHTFYNSMGFKGFWEFDSASDSHAERGYPKPHEKYSAQDQ